MPKYLGHPIAGKTGSTQLPFADITDGTKDQWFVGYTPNLVGAVWLGYDYTDREHYVKGKSGDTVVPIFRFYDGSRRLNMWNQLILNTQSINDLLDEERKNEENKDRS